MKKINRLILLLIINFFIITNADRESYSERVYIFKLKSFNRVYEIYCSKVPIGYYKYPVEFGGSTLFITYETNDFYKQCLFDETTIIYPELYPSNVWANNKGEVLRMKKNYSPVIDKDKKRKHYPAGFGKN